MNHKLKDIDQQVMVVTGASSGIGLATAIAAAEQGARVLLIARSAEILEAAVARIVDDGGQADMFVADVSDREALQAAAEFAVECFGRIDTWVNNAAVTVYGRLDEVSDEDSRQLFEINFWGVVNGSLVALPYLRRSHGALINMGSELSDAVLPLQGMYSAAKHAVKGFTDALRVEVQEVDRAQVSISLIQPTAVNTPYPQHARNYMDREPKLPVTPIEPMQVVDAILAAATQGARDVTVGLVATVNTFVAQAAPALGDKLAALAATRQQDDQAPIDPEGNLYRPSQDGRVFGPLPPP